MSDSPIEQKFSVPFDFPVIFTDNVFDPANPVLADALDRLGEQRPHRALACVDSNLIAARPGITGEITAYFEAHRAVMELAGETLSVPGGEAAKAGLGIVENLCRTMLEAHLSRHCHVIVAGGGAVLDAVGLAAALVHRGLRLIRLPTTALAQNDAGVGVKNGVNFSDVKNALGTFAPPFAVINDFCFLRTLAPVQWRDGIAEAFKVAMIRDLSFFEFLAGQSEALGNLDEAALRNLVKRCAELHLEHIRTNGDPFEFGSARPLDFGHWSAHKLELMTQFRIGHGEAVAAGIALDACYATLKGWLSEAELSAALEAMSRAGLTLFYSEMRNRRTDGKLEIFGGLRDFQEHLGGELCVTFPDGIGRRREEHAIDLALMARALDRLEEFALDAARK